MPSSKNPITVVVPGPGKLPANVANASALLFPAGGASGVSISSHITDPTDAHMSSAIGVAATDPVTSEPLLESAGGIIRGESVFDFIRQFKDLAPIPPNTLGSDDPTTPNSGAPYWGDPISLTGVNGAWSQDSTHGRVTRSLMPAFGVTNTITGFLYPADRGVLAIYKTTATNFFDSANTTLVGALWLGGSTSPAYSVPYAGFDEALRAVGQADYSPSQSGIDTITLQYRGPQSTNSMGGNYSPYPQNFSAYQIAEYRYSFNIASGDNGSYLLIHWKESYATTLASIQPAGLTSLTFVEANCYSATPSSSFFENVIRTSIYADATATLPTSVSLTTAPAGTVTTALTSGVPYYNSSNLAFTITGIANNLFANSYYTNTNVTLAVPQGYTSTTTPIAIDWSDFGGPVHAFDLFASPSYIFNNATSSSFSNGNPPMPGTVVKFNGVALQVLGSSPQWPHAVIRLQYQAAFRSPLVVQSTEKYMYNSLSLPASTNTLELFSDEVYRHVGSFTAASSTTPIIPVGGNKYTSATVITSNNGELQCSLGYLTYPSVNYTSGYFPATGPDYAAVFSGDSSTHIRRYIRAFDTGFPTSTGKLRLRGLNPADFASGGVAYTGAEVADHPGGAIVQVKVPGVTGWLDVGRAKGDPDLTTVDFHGCRTRLTISPTIVENVYVEYDTTLPTVNNGSGRYLIFVRVSYIKSTGNVRVLSELEWTAE